MARRTVVGEALAELERLRRQVGEHADTIERLRVELRRAQDELTASRDWLQAAKQKIESLQLEAVSRETRLLSALQKNDLLRRVLFRRSSAAAIPGDIGGIISE